jgi:penicillin amidase
LHNNICYSNGSVIECKSYLSKSLQKAMAQLTIDHSKKISNWKWGNVHHVVFQELALGKSKAIGWIWNRSVPSPGGDFTVNVGTYDATSINQTHGASYRQIIDLANFNNSFYIIPLGEQDNPLSVHYNNQLPLWLNGKYVQMNFKAK